MVKPVDSPAPDNGCKWWAGFCTPHDDGNMCPFPKCLFEVSRQKRRWHIKHYAIRILLKNSATSHVIQIATDVSRRTVYNIMEER